MEEGWIGVDLDGTLVRGSDWRDLEYVAAPIPEMAGRVRGWLAQGREVRIFTARVAPLFLPGATKADRMAAQKAQWAIEDWCAYHFGEKLPVTAVKDFGMALLYDDRCVPVETDTGRVLLDEPDAPQEIPPAPPSGGYPDIVPWDRLTVPLRHLLHAAFAFCLPSGGRMGAK